MRLYQTERDVEFTHEGRDYLASYVYDCDIGKSWITAIQDDEGNPVRQWQRDGKYLSMSETPRWQTLLPAAEKAMENQEQNEAERAQERACSETTGPSYAEIQHRNRIDKDGYR